MRETATQPTATISNDEKLVIAAPNVPMPNMPSAVPVRSLGYQRAT